MVIKENSNVITLRLINNYLKEQEEYLEKMWEETYKDDARRDEHCVFIGRLSELRDIQKFVTEILVVNEDK